jgi:hypothetical protein
VITHSPAAARYTFGGPLPWRTGQWADALEEPFDDHPRARSPEGDGKAILHLTVQLQPEDRALEDEEWKHAAQRFAHALGLHDEPSSAAFVWIALQAQPGRLDLIASLIRSDGTWYAPPADLAYRVQDEARRIEADLDLAAAPPSPREALRNLLAQVTAPTGPLAEARALLARASALAAEDGSPIIDSARIARRLHGHAKHAETFRDRIVRQAQDLGTGSAHPETATSIPLPPSRDGRGRTP